jgi:hypothetical protein
MTDTESSAPNVHAGARSGFDPATPPEESDGTRDGTIDDIVPLGVSADQTLDEPNDTDPESDGTTDGTIPDAGDQDTEGTDDGTVPGVAVGENTDETAEDPATGDDTDTAGPESGDDDSGPQNGS